MGHEQAHDAAAETFTVAWRRIGDVPDSDRALPWLYGVAAKTLSNQRRSQRRLRGLTEKLRGLRQAQVPQPDVQIVRRTEDQQIIDAINLLRRTDREILLLSAWEGLSAAMLAERFGISLSAAEQRLTRAKRRLATEIKTAGDRPAIAGHEPGQEKDR
jgi:RNA polymerase sigma-70 factor (ECF subfamily)